MSDLMSEMQYIGWGGKTRYGVADIELGQGISRGLPDYGPRRMLWDAAFGYVNGFGKRDILYYILTRSMNPRIERWAMKREGVQFDAEGHALASLERWIER